MGEPNYLALPPNLDARAQRKRRVARFGGAVVREMEAKVDAMAFTPGGLGRENVLSLMEGMYSKSGDALARELVRLVKRLAGEPGTRIMVMDRVAGIERELDLR